MEEKNGQIELRSEKVRNIIGQIPPMLLRYGIVIIALALLMLVGISAFIPYQPSINTEITVTQDKNGLLYFSAVIPQDVINKKSQFTEVISGTASELSLPTHYRLKTISDTVTLLTQKAWHTTTLIPKDKVSNNIQLENAIVVPAKIMLKKKSVLMWVVGKSKGI